MDDSNLVVDERAMHHRNFAFRHVTTHAVPRSYWTPCARMIAPRFHAGSCNVAIQTLRVIERRFLHQWNVRVVTSNAGNPRVPLAFSPTLAVLQAVRLQANAEQAVQSGTHRVRPRPMASSAEVHGISRAELAGAEYDIRCVFPSGAFLNHAGFHDIDIFSARAVTSFATD